MGIAALLYSTINIIGSLTNFGLARSAVKNVAVSFASGDDKKLASTATIFKKLVWITGLLGFSITVILSPILSEFAFHNKTFTLAFILIAITLLFNQLAEGQNVLLRGTRNIKDMAKASSFGALAGLLVSDFHCTIFFLIKELYLLSYLPLLLHCLSVYSTQEN